MKFFIDTEFIEDGPRKPIQLVSIGMVSESGGSLYAISSEYDPESASDWVKQNVFPFLGGHAPMPLAAISSNIRSFVAREMESHPTMGDKPEFWGYYADYDWVVFCQIFGRMIDLPKGYPMYCRDIKQLCDSLGNPTLPKQAPAEHNALNDARWNLEAYNYLMTLGAAKEAKPNG